VEQFVEEVLNQNKQLLLTNSIIAEQNHKIVIELLKILEPMAIAKVTRVTG